VLLRAQADAAEDRRAGEGCMHGELGEVRIDLRGELAGGREDQGAGHAAALRQEPLHDGEEERRGLPAAGHRAGEDVAARERGRDGVLLDGRRAGEAELARRTQEGRVEAEAGEGHERAGVGQSSRSRNVGPCGGHDALPASSEPRIDRALAATCDHLLWGAADLDVAIAALAERTEVRATAGGQHPDLGTHNAIAALGRKRFLEVIAPDPTLPPGALARWLAGIKVPTLIMWAARTPSAADTAARAEASGYQAAVVEGHRSRPDGKLVRWTNVFVSGHGGGTLVPFFVEWHGGSHPADDGPGGLRLQALRAETPQAQALRAVLKALDVRLAVRRAPTTRLVAVLDTPRGRIELAGP